MIFCPVPGALHATGDHAVAACARGRPRTLHGVQKRDLNVAYIIVTNPGKSGDILVQLSTNTYQAYNAWGGSSFYESAFIGDRAQMISFDRSTPPDFFMYEYYFVVWLEELAARHKLKVDYVSNFDVYRDPAFVKSYKLFVSGSHNEYWSREEFDAVYHRIFDLGKNTLFLGANTAYWQVRYADIDLPPGQANRGRQLICYKSEDDPINRRVNAKDGRLLVTDKFREGRGGQRACLWESPTKATLKPSPISNFPFCNSHRPAVLRGGGLSKGRRHRRCRWIRMGQC
jgi:hypothetical protein